jgi:hypothetical protein
MKSTSSSRASYLDFAAGELRDRPIALVVHVSPTMRRALLVTLDLDGFDVRAAGDAGEALLRLAVQRRITVGSSGSVEGRIRGNGECAESKSSSRDAHRPGGTGRPVASQCQVHVVAQRQGKSE